MPRGKYIVIEGLDGSGKSTQHQKLLVYLGPAAIGVREPGGSPMSEAIRSIVKDGSLMRSSRTNNYLFAAARVELLDQTIRPALQQGTHVVADRNWLSSIAYQGAEGVEIDEIETLNRLAMEELYLPDLIIFLDTDVAVCRQRLQERGGSQKDYFDERGRNYFERVRDIYLMQGKTLPCFQILNGNENPDEIALHVQHTVDAVV